MKYGIRSNNFEVLVSVIYQEFVFKQNIIKNKS